MNAIGVLRAARATGVRVDVVGTSLVLDAERAPPDNLLEKIRLFKPAILALLSEQAPELAAAVPDSGSESPVDSSGEFTETELHDRTLEQLEEVAGDDWAEIQSEPGLLTAFAHAVADRVSRERGECPPKWTARSHCGGCGPVFLWIGSPGRVLAYPWCINRVSGLPIPRPDPVSCESCSYFRRVDHPHLGHCARRPQEAIAGLWDTDRRACAHWHPREQSREGHPHDQ